MGLLGYCCEDCWYYELDLMSGMSYCTLTVGYVNKYDDVCAYFANVHE